MTIGAAPDCFSCRRFRGWNDVLDEPLCEAFPLGIPEPIFFDNVSHKVPYKGDGGLLYDAINDHLDLSEK